MTTFSCTAGCKRSAVNVDEASTQGWSYLQIQNRWRCPTCTRELEEAGRSKSFVRCEDCFKVVDGCDYPESGVSEVTDFRLPMPYTLSIFGQGCYSPGQAMLIAKAYHAWRTANDNPRAYTRQIADLTAALAEMCARMADEH
jgi:hypothetical protein